MWVLTLGIVIFSSIFYFKFIKPCKYWEKRGVPYEKPLWFLGNMASNVFRYKSMEDIITEVYKKYSNHRYVGFYRFNMPALILRNLDLIKQITIKDFDSFPEHRPLLSKNFDPLWGKNLLEMSAEDGWHSMRSTLSPSFSSNKLKTMFAFVQDCSKQFIKHFKSQNKVVSFDVKDAFSRFANDIIGTCAFGITSDSLKYPENEFYLMGKEASSLSGIRLLKLFACSIFPFMMKLLRVKMFSNKVSTFFRKAIKETLYYRKEKNIIRPDMIHLMLEAQKAQDHNKMNKPLTELTDESMTAQALLFFIAGFETVSSALTFLSYELALHPEIQQRLFEEITETLEKEREITYEDLFEMKYLDSVVSESLRLYTTVPFFDRRCVRPYTIEPVLPFEKPVHLSKGDHIWIPISGLHSNEEYFPNPKKFDPERFNAENKRNITPMTYLPFGSGPRTCIGSRFALLEVKLIIVDLLQNFEIVPNEKTQIPLRFNKSCLNKVPDDELWLSLKPRLST